jgi:hypothetical protein
MRILAPSLLVVAVAIAGCNVQRGRFGADTVTAEALSPGAGCIDIVSGSALTTLHATEGGEQNLLYVVCICQAFQAHASGSSSDFGTYITTLTHTWSNAGDKVDVVISWDRSADTVLVGKQKFARDKGNVLIVRRDPVGKITARQLASIGLHASFQQVLQYIQARLPDDKVVAGLKLVKP